MQANFIRKGQVLQLTTEMQFVTSNAVHRTGSGQRSTRRLVVLAFLALGVSTLQAQTDGDEEATAERYYTANALYNRKLYTAAIPEYQAFLAQHPKHTKVDSAKLGLGLSFFGAGNYAQAEPLLSSLAAAGKVGDTAQLLVIVGQCHMKIQGLAQAEKTFAAAAEAKGAAEFRNTALGLLTEVRYQRDDWTNTIISSDNLIRLDPKGTLTARAGYQGAYARFQLKQYPEAIRALNALMPLVKGTALETKAAFLLGESLFATGEPAKAAEQYTVATSNETGAFAGQAYYRLGCATFQLKKFDETIAAMTQSLRYQPTNGFYAQARLLSGRSALEKKDYGTADNFLRPLSMGTNVASAEATLWHARVYSRQNNNAEAEKILTNLLPRFRAENSPLLLDLLFDCGAAMMSQQKFDKATELFTEMEQKGVKDERLSDVLRLQATCLHYTRQFQRSLTYSSRFLTMHSTNAVVPFLNEALFMHAENQYLSTPPMTNEAISTFRLFLKMFPDDKNADAAGMRVAQILYKGKDLAGTLKVIAPLAAKDPKGKIFNQVRFIAGDSHFRLEAWVEAVTNLSLFVTRVTPTEPNFDTALMEMALAVQKLGKPDVAMTHLGTLIQWCPKSDHMPMALSELGRLEYEAKQYGSAKTHLERLSNTYSNAPERVAAEYYLGWITLNEQQGSEAERIFKASQHFNYVVRTGPNDPLCADSLLQLGLITLKGTKYDDAYARMTDLLNRFPNFAKSDEALYSAGVALARQNQFAAAIQNCFKPFTNRFANSELLDRALYEWAWCERKQDKKAEAVKLYELLIKSCPKSQMLDRARFEMSELTFDAKQYDNVVRDLQKALADAKDPLLKEQVQHRLAWAYWSKSDFESAAKAFEALLAQFPATDVAAAAYNQAGECRMKLGEYELACAHFTKALDAKNSKDVSESAMMRLAECLGLLKKWDDAAAMYDRFQATYPKSKWIQHARFGAGWAKENVKQYDAAISQYRKLIAEKATDEISAKSQFQIGECLFAQKKFDDAIQEFMRLDVNYRIDEWNARALLELGRVLEAKGDKQAAIARFRELIQRYPKDSASAVAKERLDALRSST